MPYYQKISGADKSLNLYALDSTKFPSSGGEYNCQTTRDSRCTTATDYYRGTSRIYCDYAGVYTLTVSMTGMLGAATSWSVSKTSSPEAGIANFTLSNPADGATHEIYRGDTLSIAATAKSTSYTAYNFSSLSAPTGSATAYNAISITNPNSVACTLLWYRTDQATLNSQSIGANATVSITGLTQLKTYEFTLKATPTRNKTTYSVSKSLSQTTVTGNVTATFTGTSTTTTESGSDVTSPATQITTPSSASWHTIWTGSTSIGRPRRAGQSQTTTISGLTIPSNATSVRVYCSFTSTTFSPSSGYITEGSSTTFNGVQTNNPTTFYSYTATISAKTSTSVTVQLTQDTGSSSMVGSSNATSVDAYY